MNAPIKIKMAIIAKKQLYMAYFFINKKETNLNK